MFTLSFFLSLLLQKVKLIDFIPDAEVHWLLPLRLVPRSPLRLRAFVPFQGLDGAAVAGERQAVFLGLACFAKGEDGGCDRAAGPCEPA